MSNRFPGISFEDAVNSELEWALGHSGENAEPTCGEQSQARSDCSDSSPDTDSKAGKTALPNQKLSSSTRPPKEAQSSSSAPDTECEIWSLASGSRANCTLIKTESAVILIDFGLSLRATKKLLTERGVDLRQLDAIFITHEHSDHIAGLASLFKYYDIPVHMTEPSYIAYTRAKGFDFRDKITVHPLEYAVNIGGMTVRSHPVSHDSAACVAYSVRGCGASFCICTDTGYVSESAFDALAASHDIIIESNHDVAMLTHGPYPYELKRRILSGNGHLSNDDCDKALIKLANFKVKRALLAHISPENNTPELALHAAIESLDRAGVKLEFIDVAPRIQPIRLI